MGKALEPIVQSVTGLVRLKGACFSSPQTSNGEVVDFIQPDEGREGKGKRSQVNLVC